MGGVGAQALVQRNGDAVELRHTYTHTYKQADKHTFKENQINKQCVLHTYHAVSRIPTTTATTTITIGPLEVLFHNRDHAASSPGFLLGAATVTSMISHP